MKKIPLFLGLFLAVLLLTYASATPEEAIEKYYSSAEAENLEEYFSVLAIADMSESEIEFEKAMVSAMWNSVEEQTHSISGLEKVEHPDGKSALLQFNLTASYTNTNTGETTRFEDVPYIALLLNEGGTWKVAFAVPFSEYVEMRQNADQIEAVEADLQEYIGEEQQLAPLYIDGQRYDPDSQPPGTLSDLKKDILGAIDMAIGLVGILIVLVFGALVLSFVLGFLKGKPKKQGMKKETPPENKPAAVKPEEPPKEASKATTLPEPKPSAAKERSSAMKILRERYAKGEITRKEFEEMKKELGD